MTKPIYPDYEQLPIFGVPPPSNLLQIEAVLRELEQGRFWAPSKLIDGMYRDDRVVAVLNTRVSGVLGANLEVIPARDTAKGAMIADEVEDLFNQIFPIAELAELFRWGILLGFAPAELEWKRDSGVWVPQLHCWHPSTSRWNWPDQSYKIVTANASEISITAGDGQWVLFTPYGYSWGWLRGSARAIIKPWLARSWALRDWSRYNEVHGLPIRTIKIPTELFKPEDEKRFLSQVANLGSEAVVRLPQMSDGKGGADLGLVEADAQNHQAFSDLIQECNKQIAITLLGQQMSTEGQAGLGSQENAGDSVRTDIKKADAFILQEVLREQVLKPFAEYNYGDPDLAPYLNWVVLPPEDTAKRAQEIASLATAIQTFSTAGAPVNVRELMEDHGVPLLDEDELEDAEEEEPQPPPQAPQDPNQEQPEDEEQQPSQTKLKRYSKEPKRAGARQGHQYSDALVEKSKQRAKKTIKPDLAKALSAVRSATSFDDLKTKLKEAYKDMNPKQMADLVKRSLMMARLCGRKAVYDDI